MRNQRSIDDHSVDELESETLSSACCEVPVLVVVAEAAAVAAAALFLVNLA